MSVQVGTFSPQTEGSCLAVCDYKAKWLCGFWKLIWLLEACCCVDVESSSVAMVLGAAEAMASFAVSPSPFGPFHLFSHSHQHNFSKMDLKDQTLSQRVSSPKVSQCKCQDTNRLVGISKHGPAGSSFVLQDLVFVIHSQSHKTLTGFCQVFDLQ